MITFAHLSDLHLDGTHRQTSRATAVISYLALLRNPVDAVLITGDLTESGAWSDYALMSSLISRLDVPVLLIPGNHDSRSGFRSLVGEDGSGPLNRTVTVGAATFLLCDSLVPGSSEGLLTPETLDWLDLSIDDAEGPVFICLHHPPAPLALPALDQIALRNPFALASILTNRPNVAAILCGHAHTAAATSFAGIPVRIAPGVKSTALLPPEVGGEYVMSSDHPVSLAFHVYDSEVLITHYRVVVG